MRGSEEQADLLLRGTEVMSCLTRRHALTVIRLWPAIIAGLLLVISTPLWCMASKNNMAAYTAYPPFVSIAEKPAVMLIFDNSGSMHCFAYEEKQVYYATTSQPAITGFKPKYNYYGYFESTAYYSYDDTNNYFYQDANGSWSGNFLNWLFMKRSDVGKKVLTGGKTATVNGATVLMVDRTDGGYGRGRWKAYDDSNTVTDINGDTRYMTPFRGKMVMQMENVTNPTPTTNPAPAVIYKIKSISNAGGAYETWIKDSTNFSGARYSFSNPYLVRVKTESAPSGIVQSAGEKIRFGLTIYDYDNGGKVKQGIGSSNSTIISAINSVYPSTWTPLAETLYTVVRYFSRLPPYFESDEYNYLFPDSGTNKTGNNLLDPYYFSDVGKFIPCSKGFVILITDGESTMDKNIPSTIRNYAGSNHTFYDSDGTDYLKSVAYYAHKNDLRADLDGVQNLTLYTVLAFGNGSDLLKDASIYGGYVDVNNNGAPNTAAQEVSASASLKEWDFDGDGMPDNYATASSGQDLENAILKAISSILARVSSATAASVISNTRSGEGAVYQAVFYPQFEDGALNKTQWAGEVHALLLDDNGNMREDTNGNGALDPKTDLIIQYYTLADGTTQVRKYKDTNGNSILDASETTPVETGTIATVNYLWNSSKWLNEISDTDVLGQRNYSSATHQRYIFTTVDADRDGIPDRTLDFACSSDPVTSSLTDTAAFYPYIHTHTPFTSPTLMPSPWSIKAADVDSFRSHQTRRVVEYIRGKDQVLETLGSSTLPAFRSRKVDYTGGTGTAKTWRLGDIAYSTPTVVNTPAEDFDLLYMDSTYSTFYAKYKNRRTVVYAGANDGMLHAFNGGFYDKTTRGFVKSLNSESAHDLGSELWAYIPFNLLPHLYWLTDPDYTHVYYVDLKPRVFDAKIFPGGTADPTHPGGWGTVLVCGMRLGGGVINADINKNDVLDAADPTMRSAYVVMDITDPESPPRVLAEFSFPELGFTTCYPTVLLTTEKDTHGTIINQTWNLVLGSGPIDNTEGAGSAALTSVTSTKSGKIYMVNLNALAVAGPAAPSVKIIDSDRTVKTATFTEGSDYLVSLDSNTSISDIVAVDFDLNYSADALYFGTVKGNLTDGWGGKLRRIVVDDGLPSATQAIKPFLPSTWITDSTLIDLSSVQSGQPITAAPTLTQDSTGNFWIFFGTGRFFTRDDAVGVRSGDVQSYYGIKEPVNTGLLRTWGTVNAATQLLDVTNAVVYETGATVSGVSGATTFSALNSLVAGKMGWYMNFPATGERNLGQAALLGDILSFTSYTPSNDYCTFEGTSNLYTLYYQTGTAYKSSVLGVNSSNTDASGNAEVLKSLSLGRGLSITPNLSAGKDDGVTAYIQQSTGGIQSIHQKNPGVVRSGFMSWQDED